jgi:hypothetical protein
MRTNSTHVGNIIKKLVRYFSPKTLTPASPKTAVMKNGLSGAET